MQTDVSADAGGVPIISVEKSTASGNTSADSLGMRLVKKSRFIASAGSSALRGDGQNKTALGYNER